MHNHYTKAELAALEKMKYKPGTKIWVNDLSGQLFHMGHFRQNCWAIVRYSYALQYGGSIEKPTEYSLLFDDGECDSWYLEDCLSLTKPESAA